MGVIVSILNNGKIGTCKGCKLDFDLDLQRETQGKFPNHTLQLVIPYVHFRNFSSYASPFYFKPFVILQVLSVLLQGGFKEYSTPLTMFSTILNIFRALLELCIFFVQFLLCFKVVVFMQEGLKSFDPFTVFSTSLQVGFKELQPFHCVLSYLHVGFKEL
jgi:hypothetical protein